MADDEDLNPFVRRGVPAGLLLAAVPVVYVIASAIATAAAPSDGSHVYPLAFVVTCVIGAVLGLPTAGVVYAIGRRRAPGLELARVVAWTLVATSVPGAFAACVLIGIGHGLAHM